MVLTANAGIHSACRHVGLMHSGLPYNMPLLLGMCHKNIKITTQLCKMQDIVIKSSNLSKMFNE